MSYQQVVARRYAKGLKLLLDKNDLPSVEQQFKDFVVLFSSHPELRRVFSDPAFNPFELRAVIDNLAKKLGMSEQLHHFLLLLIERRRIAQLPAIFEAFVLLVDESLSRLRATIKSATKVSSSRLEEITKSLAVLGKKEVLINNVVDHELLAGIRVEVAGTVFDGTLKAKLDAMRSQLLHGIKQ